MTNFIIKQLNISIKNNYLIYLLKTIILIILFIPSHSTYAVKPEKESDYVLLPPYCKARKSGDRNEYKAWEKRIGHDFLHVHHYCNGLHALNLAGTEKTKSRRTELLKRAIAEMAYVKKHASQQFILQPKISYDMGRVYEQLQEPGKAMRAYQNSISLNPKVAPPYAAISNLYIKQNNQKDAITILKQGLKYNPNSITLKKRLKKITE